MAYVGGLLFWFIFFLFKQKTAYEMRISDWSSDVCSSDLVALDDVNSLRLPVQILRPVENAFIGRERARLELAIRAGWTLTVCSGTAADDLARIALNEIGRASCGKECVSTCRSRWSPCHYKTKEHKGRTSLPTQEKT